MAFHVPEHFRIVSDLRDKEARGHNCGRFLIERPPTITRNKSWLFCVASDGLDWEHVSVSMKHRCPTWDEMTYVKSIFWDDEDTVMQLHVPQADHINNHPYCLHLWRPIEQEIPVPPYELVGLKT